MSEKDDSFDSFGIVFAVGVILMLILYFEIDSRFQLSQLRDLQRRVAELEQKP